MNENEFILSVSINVRKYDSSEDEVIKNNLLFLESDTPLIHKETSDAFKWIAYKAKHLPQEDYKEYSKHLVRKILKGLKFMPQITIDIGNAHPREVYEFSKEECLNIIQSE